MTSRRAEPHRPRLLVLASTYPRWAGDPEPGFVHELCRRLARRFEVVVVCPGAHGALPREILDGVEVRRFRYAPSKLQSLVNDGGITGNLRRSPWKYLLVPPFLLGMLVGTLRAIRDLRPDVVHAHWLLPQGLVAAMARPARIPLVLTSHGADLYAWRAPFHERLKKWVLRSARTVTVVSSPMLDDVSRLGAGPRALVAPMGVDLEAKFTPDASTRSTKEILFVGRLVEKKGLRHLVDAMPAIRAVVPDATLTIAGSGPEMEPRKAQVAALGLGDAVRFAGPVAQGDLVPMYRNAAVFVAPFVPASDGDREGLGLVSLEAAGCGCPVVVSDVPVVHDIFADGEALFAQPGNAGDLADKVVSVLAGVHRPPPGLRDSLRERFGWERVTRRYLDILLAAADRDSR